MDTLRWTSLLASWHGARGPLYRQLSTALSGCVQSGQLTPGEQLPSERRLADLLQVSRSTVVAAYEELASGGWVSRRQGSGTHVAATAPRQQEVLALRSPVIRSPVMQSPVMRSPVRPLEADQSELDLTIAVPQLGQAQRGRLERASAGAFGESLYHPLGLPELRAVLAEMYTRQGLPTRTEQVVVTTGAQQAISVIAGTLLGRDDLALLETPTYFGAIDVFRAQGAKLQGLPVASEGIRPEELRRRLPLGPRLAFLTPTYQNPSGTVLPASSREQIAHLLAGADLPTIEDDTLIDLAFEGAPPPRLACFAPQAPIICVGSLSKLFWAGLRVGWMRLPGSLAPALVQHKTLADFGSSMPSQVMALALLRDLDSLKAERRAEVLPARDLLVGLLRGQLPDWSFRVPDGGQFLWAELPTRNASGYTQVARRHGVRLFPGASMGVSDLPDRYLRLPFTLPPADLPEAVARLARAWHSFQERGTGERLA